MNLIVCHELHLESFYKRPAHVDITVSHIDMQILPSKNIFLTFCIERKRFSARYRKYQLATIAFPMTKDRQLTETNIM